VIRGWWLFYAPLEASVYSVIFSDSLMLAKSHYWMAEAKEARTLSSCQPNGQLKIYTDLENLDT
jgi:hypothetical protein